MAEGADEDEARSVVTELDYSKKDATRHIVANRSGSKGDSLRQKLLRNLESVKKNKPLLKSENSGSQLSAQSRYSKVSARISKAGRNQNDGRLTRIEEADDGEAANMRCEACAKDVVNEEDMSMNEEITKQAPEEANIKKAYAEFRNVKGLAPVDWAANPDHKVSLCIECLLEAFQARRVEAGDYELDEVSQYRGTIMQGIGLTMHGRYPRKLGDEL